MRELPGAGCNAAWTAAIKATMRRGPDDGMQHAGLWGDQTVLWWEHEMTSLYVALDQDGRAAGAYVQDWRARRPDALGAGPGLVPVVKQVRAGVRSSPGSEARLVLLERFQECPPVRPGARGRGVRTRSAHCGRRL
jgi:hypothetical protein